MSSKSKRKDDSQLPLANKNGIERPNNTAAEGPTSDNFVSSLRILFDILDVNKNGFIYFTDIEAHWKLNQNSNENSNSSRHILEALYRLSLQNGILTFDRFVMGLKFALLECESQSSDKNLCESETESMNAVGELSGGGGPPKSAFAPFHDSWKDNRSYIKSAQTHDIFSKNRPNSNTNLARSKPQTATVKPNNILIGLKPESSQSDAHGKCNRPESDHYPSQNRNSSNSLQTHIQSQVPRDITSPPTVPPRLSSRNVTEQLKWRQLQKQSFRPFAASTGDLPRAGTSTSIEDIPRKDVLPRDGGSNRDIPKAVNPRDADIPRNGDITKTVNPRNAGISRNSDIPMEGGDKPKVGVKPTVRVTRRDSARRHTLTSGVDNIMIKRMRQLEEEKGVLLQGLTSLEKGMDWFQGQIEQVETKLQTIGHSHHTSSSIEANRERLDLMKSQVTAVTKQLSTLSHTSHMGFPVHMSLAVPTGPIALSQHDSQLRDKELADQSQRISQLEQEKCSLIRQLFEVSGRKPMHNDTTFI